MNKSDQINELASAMAQFQGECLNIFKGSKGHGYSYADLASIIDLIKPLLKSNGLSVVQMPINAEHGFVGVETMILHSSGQWLSQEYSMGVPDNKRNSLAQNIGSGITYARRYALAAALNIAQTDDDASNYANIELHQGTEAVIKACDSGSFSELKALLEAFDSDTKKIVWSELADQYKAKVSAVMGGK